MIRTIIAEDNKIFRKTLNNFLAGESNFEIVAEVDSGINAVAVVEEKSPDLVIMDIRMPGGDGLSATRKIKKFNPNIKVVMLTLWDEKQLRDEADKSGADAYVIKNQLYDNLIPTIQGILGNNHSEK